MSAPSPIRAAAIGLLSLALLPSVAAGATASGAASAVTVRPLSMVKTADLDFGTLAPSALAGTAIVNASTDARSTTGGVAGAGGGTPGAAKFTAAGLAGLLAVITLPASITLTRGGGTETMTVGTITTNGATTRLFPGTATLDVRVGGTLNVAANQVAGSYAGTFSVTVLYF